MTAVQCALVAILSVSLILSPPSLSAKTEDRFADQRASLKIDSPQRFVEKVDTNRWNAPAIASIWYLRNRTPKEKIDQETARREFGRLFNRRIRELAVVVETTEDRQALRKTVEVLLRLEHWIGNTAGYGNLLLAARCRDVASAGIGKLLVRFDASLEVCQKQINDLGAPTPLIIATVLNGEIGIDLFSGSSQEGIEEFWRLGELMWRKGKSGLIANGLSTQLLKEIDQLREKIGNEKYEIFEDLKFNERFGFFHDDDMFDSPPTLSNTWDNKRHAEIVSGLIPRNLTRVRDLITFRSVIGMFPTEDVKHPFYKGGEAAFDKAWRSRATSENLNLGSSAWRTYDAILKGKFLDEDTRMERSEKNDSGR